MLWSNFYLLYPGQNTSVLRVKWKSLSRVQLFATPWTVILGILQARILEWVAFPFSRVSFQPRDQTQFSHIIGRFFTSLATRKDPHWKIISYLRRVLGGQGILSPMFKEDQMHRACYYTWPWWYFHGGLTLYFKVITFYTSSKQVALIWEMNLG